MGSAQGDEFRVYTRLIDLSRPAEPGAPSPPVVSRSLTLFHAGQAFDYLDEIGELTVFQPARNRFVVISGQQPLSTVVDFEELQRLEKVSREGLQRELQQLARRDDRAARESAELIRFALAPQFDESFDAATGVLTLTSPRWRYRVECVNAKDAALLNRYLDYADWTRRLNAVLHPNSLFPAPRIVLNDRLRARRLWPVVVELELNITPPIRLRAEHQFHWRLDSKDRGNLLHWTSLLQRDERKQVPLAEYQKRMLGAMLRR
ncbi:MAG: hypothetical protein D6725_08605 [Planctomycetota bacterium]|nr:MAG: hypothetical protein D6725_08605 [Planctomycetota bacterium]